MGLMAESDYAEAVAQHIIHEGASSNRSKTKL